MQAPTETTDAVASSAAFQTYALEVLACASACAATEAQTPKADMPETKTAE